MPSIMVVDDNPGARQFLAASLKPLGLEVRVVEPTCLFEVFEALHAQPPDLLVTDLVMPGCPGQTLVRLCREDPHLRHVKIIVLTAHGSEELGRYLQAMGNVHYLAKPISPAILAGCAERFLEGTLNPDPGWSLACKGVVAVLDDSRLSRAFHGSVLRKHGFRPVEIEPTDLVGTRKALEQAAPDLILLDFLMPNFNGDALLRVIQATEELRQVPVIMVTAHQNPDDEMRLGMMHGVEVLMKPVSADDLIARVRAVLGQGG